MEYELIFAWVGFLLATYAVLGNDAPAQVLGTLIASHPNNRWILWVGSSSLLVVALVVSWLQYGGIAFDRLEEIPYVPMEWYYLLGPISLLVITRFGIPVSTSLMCLAMFSAGVVLEDIIIKSVLGYVSAFFIAFCIWYLVGYLGRTFNGPANMRIWRPMQYLSTGILWWWWMVHDLANIAVFLPRQISVTELVIVAVVSVAALGLIFKEAGGRVHKVVFKDETDMDIRLATFIDFIYAAILFIFIDWNSLPMSTTWVFVGLMGGREIARSIWGKQFNVAIKSVGLRLGMITFGAMVSLGMVGIIMLIK